MIGVKVRGGDQVDIEVILCEPYQTLIRFQVAPSLKRETSVSKLWGGACQRTSEPFLPICDNVQTVRYRPSLEVESHRLEVSTLELGLNARDHVPRGKSRET